MPGFLAQLGAVTQCFHQAPVNPPAGNPRVLLSGAPALTVKDILAVTGCPFTLPGPVNHPCITVRLDVSTKVLIDTQPALLASPAAMCIAVDGVPQGLPMGAPQVRVSAL